MHRRCRHHRRYFAVSWRTECTVLPRLHERVARKSAERRVESECQDLDLVNFYIALAIGPAFEPYAETTMGVLRQAGGVMPSPVRKIL